MPSCTPDEPSLAGAVLTADDVIRLLQLQPLEFEGGYLRETWRDAAGTAVWYLLRPGTVSRLHRLPQAETWHFYRGDLVRLLLLYADGSSETVLLGPHIEFGQQPQKTVPAGTWQGAWLEETEGRRRKAENEHWALLGTTVAPPFRQSDFEAASRHELLRGWPDRKDLIIRLTEEDL